VADPLSSAAPAAPSTCDLAVVGGGIVGLAVARELLARHPRASVTVLEREQQIGAHQTGHNSGVIHAGIYYAPGSLKARMCVAGAREMYEYCEQHGVAHDRCGKLIVATDPSELHRLAELERRGAANGVSGIRRVEREELRELEPHVAGIAGIFSPATGITDFGAVARAFAGDVVDAGGAVVTDCGVKLVRSHSRSLSLVHDQGVTEARNVVFCAGAWADRLAVQCGAPADPRIVPFRGAYLRLRPQRRDLVRSLIYPVPDPALPFLGVHFTRTITGEVLIGPTALLAGARNAYDLRRVSPRDLLDTLSWPGSWRMFRRWWRTGVTEAHHALSRSTLVGAAARYVPELDVSDVEPSFAGVRAQALARDGALVDDFVFSATDRALHVRNAPSPAATSSLAIARHVVDNAQKVFGQ
jgi:L-2-hydroxyglutarate oxidase